MRETIWIPTSLTKQYRENLKRFLKKMLHVFLYFFLNHRNPSRAVNTRGQRAKDLYLRVLLGNKTNKFKRVSLDRTWNL